MARAVRRVRTAHVDRDQPSGLRGVRVRCRSADRVGGQRIGGGAALVALRYDVETPVADGVQGMQRLGGRGDRRRAAERNDRDERKRAELRGERRRETRVDRLEPVRMVGRKLDPMRTRCGKLRSSRASPACAAPRDVARDRLGE